MTALRLVPTLSAPFRKSCEANGKAAPAKRFGVERPMVT